MGEPRSPANVVTLYLLPALNVRHIPQREKLRPGSRIVSHDFDMQGVTPVGPNGLLVAHAKPPLRQAAWRTLRNRSKDWSHGRVLAPERCRATYWA